MAPPSLRTNRFGDEQGGPQDHQLDLEDVVLDEVDGGILDGGQDLIALPDEEVVDRRVQDFREGPALRTARPVKNQRESTSTVLDISTL